MTRSVLPFRGRTIGLIKPTFAVVACLAVFVGGCGSSKKSSSRSGNSRAGAGAIAITSAPPGPQPTPKVPLASFEKRLTAVFAAAAAGDCGPAKRFVAVSNYQLRCTQGKPDARVSGFKVTGSATYGTGAIIEYTDAEVAQPPRTHLDVPGATPPTRRNTAVFPVALGASGRYMYIPAGPSPILAGPFIGTKPNGWSGADATAITYLKSIRDGDCATWFKYSVTPQGMSQPQACKLGLTPAASTLGKLLRTSRSTKLYRLGGNAVWYFYGLQVGGATGTLGVGRDSPPAPPFIALGVLRGPSR